MEANGPKQTAHTDAPVGLLLVTLPEPGIFSYDQTLK